MQQLLSNNIDQRFGMFIHYNMNTYYYGWGEKRVDPRPLRRRLATATPLPISGQGGQVGRHEVRNTDHQAPRWIRHLALQGHAAVNVALRRSLHHRAKCRSDHGCGQVLRRFFPRPGTGPNLYFSIWDPNNGIGSVAGHNTDPARSTGTWLEVTSRPKSLSF